MNKKKIPFILKTFFSGIIPFTIAALFIHVEPSGGISFSLNFFDLLNSINFLLFFYVKKKLILKKQKEFTKHSEADSSVYHNATMTPSWTYDSFNKNMTVLELFINNIITYIFATFLFLYFFIKNKHTR